jgi:hypothetical protein
VFQGEEPLDRPRLEALLHRPLVRRALPVLRRASARRDCVFPIDWDRHITSLDCQPHRARFSDAARLVVGEALRAGLNRDVATSFAWLDVALRMADHISMEASPLAQAVAHAIRRRVVHVAARVMDGRSAPPELCHGLYRRLAAFDYPGHFARALAADRAGRLDEYRTFMENPREVAEDVIFWYPLLNRLARPLMYLDELTYLRLSDKAMALQDQPYRDLQPAFEAIAREAGRHWWRHPVATWWARDAGQRWLSRDRAIAWTGLGQTALALEVYHGRHGRYPDALADLAADPGWALPEDPFSGAPFRYRREGRGYTLYSFGRDLDDDGGRGQAQFLGNGRDLVLRCAN